MQAEISTNLTPIPLDSQTPKPNSFASNGGAGEMRLVTFRMWLKSPDLILRSSLDMDTNPPAAPFAKISISRVFMTVFNANAAGVFAELQAGIGIIDDELVPFPVAYPDTQDSFSSDAAGLGGYSFGRVYCNGGQAQSLDINMEITPFDSTVMFAGFNILKSALRCYPANASGVYASVTYQFRPLVAQI